MNSAASGASASGTAYHALTVLTRLAQRRPDCVGLLRQALATRVVPLLEVALEVAIETGDPIGQQLAEELEGNDSGAFLQSVQDFCDLDRYLLSVPLREVARVATEGTFTLLRRRRENLNVEEQFDYVIAANNLALRLLYIGTAEAGLEPIKEALRACEDLVSRDPQRFRPALASVWGTYSMLLAALDRGEEALCADENALRVLRLQQPDPAEEETYLEDLAGALNNLGSRLARLDRLPEGLRAIEQSVELWRRLPWQVSEVQRSFLATALLNLGNCLSRLGRLDEALQATREGVELKRICAESRPDAFLPDLARSLQNCARRFDALNRGTEALDSAREAFGIWQELVDQRPSMFLSDFTKSLVLLGRRLEQVAAREELLELVRTGARVMIPVLSEAATDLGTRTTAAVERYLDFCDDVGFIPVEVVRLARRAGLDRGTEADQRSVGPDGSES